jgi:hypothetical protein
MAAANPFKRREGGYSETQINEGNRYTRKRSRYTSQLSREMDEDDVLSDACAGAVVPQNI